MNHIGTKTIETNRLILREFKSSDSENMFKNWAGDSKVTKYLSWDTYRSVNDAKEIIKLWISNYEDKSSYNWAIELKEVNGVIGSISVVKLENENKSCEIGYCIGSKFWNKGITTEAFKSVIDYLFREVKVNRISARHSIENLASGEVMKKCKMKYEGTLREVQFINNKPCSTAVYSILRSEWLNIN